MVAGVYFTASARACRSCYRPSFIPPRGRPRGFASSAPSFAPTMANTYAGLASVRADRNPGHDSIAAVLRRRPRRPFTSCLTAPRTLFADTCRT